MNMLKLSMLTVATKAVTKRIAELGMHGFVCAVVAGMMVGRAEAASGTWNKDLGGDWTDITKWLGDLAYASDADSTATLGNNISANRAINLNAAITIGNITASDTTHDYTISGANILTLDRTDAIKPTINVTSGRTLFISSVIAGNDGLQKIGAGSLELNASNTFTGNADIAAGTIKMSTAVNDTRLFGASGNTITFTGSVTIQTVADGGYDLPQNITINNGVTGTILGAFGESVTAAGVISGTGSLTIQGNSNGFGTTLSNTANTFTGAISINPNSTTTLSVASLGSSVANAITMGGGGNNPYFNYTGSAALSRPFAIATTTGGVNINSTGSGALTASGFSVTGAGAKTITIGGASTASNTIAGNIVNNGGNTSLTKADAGKWILTGANTYSGTTTISGGTLEIGGSGSLGSSGTYAATISNAGTLRFNSSANQTLGGAISGAGALIQDGTGILTLTAANTYSGSMTVNAGTLSLGTSNSILPDASTLSVGSSALLNLNYTGSDTVLYFNLSGGPAAAGEWGATDSDAANKSPLITGTGRINNLGGDASSFNIGYWDGGTIDKPGVGNLASGGTSGTWNTSLKNWDYGTVAYKVWANTTLSSAVFGGTAGTVTLSEPVSIKNLTINTANYIITGSTLNFTSGDINIAQASTIRSAIIGSPTMTDGGASASYTYLNPTSGNMTLGTITRNVDKYLYLQGSSTSSNSIASIPYGAANAKLYFESGTWTLGNVYGGEFFIKSSANVIANGELTTQYRYIYLQAGGVLHYNNSAAVRGHRTTPANTVFWFEGGSLDNSSGAAITTSTHNPKMSWRANWTFIGSQGANSDLYLGNGAVDLTATQQVTVQNVATTLEVGGVISGTGFGLTKAGAGTLKLSGINTYSGATTISAGTLKLGANNVLPSTAVSIGAAKLDADIRTDIVGTLNCTGAATINLGSAAAALVFADSSAINSGTWAGSLNITVGTLGPTSIKFGTTSGGLTTAQLAKISVNGSGAGTYTLDASGYLMPQAAGTLIQFF